jgi:DNA-binding transcriptional LysR family regulator
MDRLLSMRTFASVIDEGSFAGASRRLVLDQAVVTRLIADLEAHLGARLLNRTTRSLNLTEAGEAYLARCRQILADIDAAEEMVGAGTGSIAGRVKMAVPVEFGLEVLAPKLRQFHQRYPDITLEVGLFEHSTDPIASGYDLTITPTTYGMSTTLVARPLGQSPIVLCASPGYLELNGVPKQPLDLAGHDCIGYSGALHRDHWKLTDAEGKQVLVPVSPILQSNDFALVRRAVLDGSGIGTLLHYGVADRLADGRLVRVLPQWHAGTVLHTIVYPSREHLPRRVRAVIDFFVEERGELAAHGVRLKAEAV